MKFLSEPPIFDSYMFSSDIGAQAVIEVHCVGDRVRRVIERLCAADAGAFRPREVRCVRVSPNAAMVYAAREDADEEDGGEQ